MNSRILSCLVLFCIVLDLVSGTCNRALDLTPVPGKL